MSARWAEENLAAIRVLMERAALYRRALPPLFLLAGSIGSAAAVGGIVLGIDSARGFILFWSVVALGVAVASLMVARRQALQENEPFWTPPARRVFRAVLPAFASGVAIGICIIFPSPSAISLASIPAIWMILYGTAIHSAAFFLPRGCHQIAWLFLGSGMLLLALQSTLAIQPPWILHAEMGAIFGGLHLFAGTVLKLRKANQPN